MSRTIANIFRLRYTSNSSLHRRQEHYLTYHKNGFHFDTHQFVQRLEKEGLTRAQAEGIMMAMAGVIDESVKNTTSTMVTKADQEKVCFFFFFTARIHVILLL